jgi:hypothetical protein
MLLDGASKLGHESNQALFEARAQLSQPDAIFPTLAQRFIKDYLHANGWDCVRQGALRQMSVLNLGAGVSTRNAPIIAPRTQNTKFQRSEATTGIAVPASFLWFISFAFQLRKASAAQLALLKLSPTAQGGKRKSRL